MANSSSSKDLQAGGRHARKKKSAMTKNIIAVLIFLAGIAVSLYPYVAQQINKESATRLIAAFNESVTTEDYGSSNNAGVPVQEIDEHMFGSIVIPKLSLELPIYIGATDENLSKGIAHLAGTSLPTGGKSTHTVLAGHSYAVTNEWFTRIDQLGPGDTFSLYNGKDTLTYQVISTRIIAPTDTSSLLIEEGQDLATLLTCTPSGAERFIVTGERVSA